MSDDLTEKLIGEKSIQFDKEVSVRDSLSPNGESLHSLYGDKTDSRSKNKSNDMRPTRFGSSTTAKPLDPEELQKIKDGEKDITIKDKYLKKNGKDEFIAEYGEEEYNKLYVCDDEKSCCGKDCVVSGGKKTKRRRYTRKYTKKYRSRKSRKSKKGSRNNKK